jgi:iron complex transport system ATP-binding protein
MRNEPVLNLTGVRVTREHTHLLDDVSWTVGEGERWVVLGPNGAGKTTLLKIASANLFPTNGTVEILSERLGAVDVFELRPRIGLSSAAMADRIPASERVRDVVLTASYAVVGRWRESYGSFDVARAGQVLEQLGCAHLADRR